MLLKRLTCMYSLALMTLKEIASSMIDPNLQPKEAQRLHQETHMHSWKLWHWGFPLILKIKEMNNNNNKECDASVL